MRLTLRCKLGLLAVAGAISVGGHGVRADEMLVMPYSCRMIGGEPVLRPSREQQGHAVIGRREHRPFRTCSPVNPDLCQRWTVHRFDLDCDGQRVPWVEVAAAAEAARRDGVFLSGDQLEIEMPVEWSLPPGARCGRYREGDAERFGSFDRFCAERLARTRRIPVAMPPGFAPLFGIDGIFVADTSPRVARAAPVPVEREFTEVPVPLPKPKRTPESATERRVEKTAPQKEAAAPTPAPAPVRAAPPAPEPEAKPAPAPEPVSEPERSAPPVAGDVAAAAAPVVPQILNGKNALPPPPPAEEDGAVTGPSLPTAGEEASVSDPPRPAAEMETGSLGPATAPRQLPALGTSTPIAGALLAMLSLLTLSILWWRGRNASRPVLSRDIAAVSLEKRAVQDSAGATFSALPVVPPAPTGRDLEPSLGMPGPAEPLGDGIPQTRAEALRVLGMGVGPDVSEAAIKKIVDGLRASWHPDRARDAGDCATREQRIKQINAAWDLLAGRSSG